MSWLVSIYSLLLRLYPADFRDEFAEEMARVFVKAMSEERRRGWLPWLLRFGKETAGVFTGLARELWLRLGWEDRAMNPMISGDRPNVGGTGEMQTPAQIIAGIVPFILFGLMFTLLGIAYHRPMTWMGNSMVVYLFIHVLLLIGLGIGWAKRFPRWSYAYLGAVIIITSWLAGISTYGFRLFGYTFGRERWGWRAWLPLLILTAVMLLITRSPRRFTQLFRGIKKDWTYLSLALYAAVAWLLMLVTYDSKSWYNQTAYLPVNLFLLTILITGGAFFYLWERRSWRRVLALQATLFLFFLVSYLVTTLDGHVEFGSPSTVIGQLLYLLFFLTWASVPLVPGLAHGVWRRLRPI